MAHKPSLKPNGAGADGLNSTGRGKVINHTQLIQEYHADRLAFAAQVEARTTECRRLAVYVAALRLVEVLDPEPGRNTSVRINGRWCHSLGEAMRELGGIGG